jgi:hypothetical protein
MHCLSDGGNAFNFEGCAFGFEGCAFGFDGCAFGFDGCASNIHDVVWNSKVVVDIHA